MEIYPAIDVLGGKVVRLFRGDFGAATTYGRSVEGQLAVWMQAGARWVHVVDLDGARTGEPDTELWRTVSGRGVPVQLGGGIRGADDAEAAMASGVSRVIMGTSAVWSPEVLEEAIARSSPDRVVAAIDVRNGRAGGSGWLDEGRDLPRVVEGVIEAGVVTFLVTAISRDGTMTGPDVELLNRVRVLAPGIEIMAAGGIASMEDLRTLASAGVDGAVIGRALYEGGIELSAALAEFGRQG